MFCLKPIATEMKISRYVIGQELQNNAYLLTNFTNKTHIIVSEEVFSVFNDKSISELKKSFPNVFERLRNSHYILEDSVDEFEELRKRNQFDISDNQMYHLVINPTLDCNLSCWYCYEKRVPNSSISDAVVNGICKHISLKFNEEPFSFLKISFFGGEPLMKFSAIEKIAKFASSFSKCNKINLLLDFTTNGTLLTSEKISRLSNYACSFQITLDGNKEQHNKVKYTKSRSLDTFSLTINNIKEIQRVITDSFVSVRINYDEETLKDFSSVLEELSQLDRTRCKIILKKIWQVSTEKLSEELVIGIADNLRELGFVVDEYGDPGVCFADRRNQSVINYDGNIFKCTTIDKFDSENALGKLDTETGKIIWDDRKIAYLNSQDLLISCSTCVIFPTCTGPCRRRILLQPNWECPYTKPDFDVYYYARSLFYNEIASLNLSANLTINTK